MSLMLIMNVSPQLGPAAPRAAPLTGLSGCVGGGVAECLRVCFSLKMKEEVL